MKILITGATGFIGTNLTARIRERYPDTIFLLANSKTPPSQLAEYAKICDAVFYLAAIHRSSDERDFQRYNCDLLKGFLESLEAAGNRCPVIFTSSRQAGESSAYGLSKIMAEKMVWAHAEKSDSSCVVYRLTNTFGRHARPYGHSVVATFCHNLQRDIPIIVNNPDTVMNFYYIDDVVVSLMEKMSECLRGEHIKERVICRLPEEKIHSVTLGKLADKLRAFQKARQMHLTPETATLFDERLLYTFDGYAPGNADE